MDGPVAGHERAGGALRIPPGRHRFEFRYTGLSFVAPEKVSFKYRLQGLGAGMDRCRDETDDYLQLYSSPGNYQFQVMACNSDGVWDYASRGAGVYGPTFFLADLVVLSWAGFVRRGDF